MHGDASFIGFRAQSRMPFIIEDAPRRADKSDWSATVWRSMTTPRHSNNLAERQLRPAVIARKISCGNKTPKGARTWQILTSLAATCAQRATSFIAALARAAPLQGR
jgi:hypothetical protein